MTTNYLDAAIETVLEAGKILREEYALPPDIDYKGDVDLVTQADKRSETAIVTRLSRLFPEHTIAAEEGTGHVRSSEFHWHVDPLDGTTTPRISRINIRASRFQLRWLRMERSSQASFTIPFTMNSLPRRAAKGQP